MPTRARDDSESESHSMVESRSALLLAALPRRGRAARRPRAPLRGRRSQVVAAENFWGSIAAQLGGEPVRGTQRHRQPGDRPAQLRADALRRPDDLPARRSRSSTGSATTPGPPGSSPPTARAAGTVISVGDVLGLGERRQPAPVVLAGRPCARWSRRSPPPTSQRRPGGRRATSRRGSGASRRRRSRATTRCGPRSAGGSPACRSATARASSSRSARASACGC